MKDLPHSSSCAIPVITAVRILPWEHRHPCRQLTTSGSKLRVSHEPQRISLRWFSKMRIAAVFRFGWLVLAIGIISTHFSVVAAQQEFKFPDSWDVQQIDQFLEHHSQTEGQVGYAVALIRNGQIVHLRGYGKRKFGDPESVSANTVFAIGSVSKQFTCAAILLLAEQGKLKVQDKVAHYYPKATRAQEITLLDLMQHTAGYPDYYPLDFVDRRMKKDIEPDELLRQYAGGALDFEPRTRYSYSNTGFIMLARIVEKVSKKDFGAFLADHFFEPLKMTNTSYELSPKDSRIASGHATWALGKPRVVQAEGIGWLGGAGGIYSTAADLALWNIALMEGRVLKPRSWEIMTTPATLKNGTLTTYGCGLAVQTREGRKWITHSGAVSGFAAWSGFVPSTQSSVVMLSNLEGSQGRLASDLLALANKASSTVPAIQNSKAQDQAVKLLAAFQQGSLDRTLFAEEFNHFLTPEYVQEAQSNMASLGKLQTSVVLSLQERGGMEVSTIRHRYFTRSIQTLMYRRPSGIIEQFFILRDQ